MTYYEKEGNPIVLKYVGSKQKWAAKIVYTNQSDETGSMSYSISYIITENDFLQSTITLFPGHSILQEGEKGDQCSNGPE